MAGSAAAPAAKRRNCLRGCVMALPPRNAATCSKSPGAHTPRLDSDLGLECSPADGTGAATENKGVRHVPPAALRVGYITFANERKGQKTVLALLGNNGA